MIRKMKGMSFCTESKGNPLGFSLLLSLIRGNKTVVSWIPSTVVCGRRYGRSDEELVCLP